MDRALQDPASEASCLEFFGLDRAPFARLGGPSSIFHAEQYSLLFNHLKDAKTESDHLVVLRGVDGSGKTTLLNRFLAGFNDEETFASIDDSCGGAADFYQRFFEQIGFKNIDGKLEELQAITREFLVHRFVVGDPMLLVMDNVHVMHPAVIEELCWLSGIQRNGRRVFSLVLAGNDKLGRLLDAPAMTDMTFLRRVDFHVRAYSEEETTDYILYRLMLAGADKRITFTPQALALVYRFTGGIPRSINRLCALLLGQAYSARTHTIDDTIVRAVAEAEQLPTNVFPKRRRARRKTDNPLLNANAETGEMEKISLAEAMNKPLYRDRISVSRRQDVDVAHLHDQVAKLSAEIGRLKAQKAEDAGLQQTLETQRMQLEAARSKATRAETRIAKLEAAKAQLMQTSSQLLGDLSEARRKVAALAAAERRLEKTEQEKQQLLDDLAALEKLRGQIATRGAKATALKVELSELGTSGERTRARLAVLPEPNSDDDTRQDRDGPRIVGFEVLRQGRVESVYEIEDESARVMIGRGDDADLPLDSEFVSRHHALVYCRRGDTCIEDLHSFNGTIVNGKAITRALLSPDDAIIIGEFRLRPLT